MADDLSKKIFEKLDQILSMVKSLDRRVGTIEKELKEATSIQYEPPPAALGLKALGEEEMIPLPIPSDFSARPIGFSSVRLDWKLAYGEYDVVLMRMEAGGDFAEVWRGSSNTKFWIDKTPLPGHTYEYTIFTVIGKDKGGMAKAQLVTMPILESFTSRFDGTAVTLQWMLKGNFSGKLVMRRREDNQANFANIGLSISKDSNTFRDTAIKDGHKYFYKLIPINELGEEEPGLDAAITVPQREAPAAERPSAAPPEKKEAPPMVTKLAAGGKEVTEKILGGNWLSMIGIVIFVLGVIYFLKYSFDNNWIGPWGRVSIGLVTGVGLMALAEFFHRRKYYIHSQVFTAGGILILYASFLVATHLYRLIGPYATLVFLTATSALCSLAAIRHNSLIIASLGVVGAYVAPLVIGVRTGRVPPLLGYLTAINSGAMFMVAFKKWRPILWAVLLFAAALPLVVVINKDPTFLFLYLIIFMLSGLFLLARLGWTEETMVLVILGFLMPLAANYSSTMHSVMLPIYLIAILCTYMYGFKKVAHPGLVSGLVFMLLLIPLIAREFSLNPLVFLPPAIFSAVLWIIRTKGKTSPIISYCFWALVNLFPLFMSRPNLPATAPFAVYAAYFVLASIAVVVYSLRKGSYLVTLFASLVTYGLAHFWLYKSYSGVPMDDTKFFWQYAVFASVSFFVYLVPAIYSSLKKDSLLNMSLSLFTVVAAFAYFAVMYYPLKTYYPSFPGVLALLLSVVYMGVGYLFYYGHAKELKEKILALGQSTHLLLVVGLSLSFITVAAAVQFRDARITTFIWAVESFLILWGGLKVGSPGLRAFSLLLMLLAVIKGLTIDFWRHYEVNHYVFLNPRFVVLAVTALVLGCSAYLYKYYEKNITKYEKGLSKWLFIGCNLFLFASVMSEVRRFFTGSFRPFAQQVYWALHGGILACFFKRLGWIIHRAIGYLLFLVAFCGWLHLTFGIPASQRGATVLVLNWYFAAGIVFSIFSFLLYKMLKAAKGNLTDAEKRWTTPALILANIVLLTSFSAEAYHHFINEADGLNIVTMSMTVMWAIYAFIMMGLGFAKEFRILRICSLVLFAITIVKLFVYDVWLLNKIYRIAAFVILGIVLLVSSFFYHRFKEKIFENIKGEGKI